MSENRRRNNRADMSIVEQIKCIKEQMCDGYCHYKKTYRYESDLEEKCESCPLTRL